MQAWELAEIDLISRGRLITGWVRGAGSEQFFNNANPIIRLETHLVRAASVIFCMSLTRPGMFRNSGTGAISLVSLLIIRAVPTPQLG